MRTEKDIEHPIHRTVYTQMRMTLTLHDPSHHTGK